MTTTAEPRAALKPARISRLDVPDVEALSNDAVRGFFNHQQREEGLTSNWFALEKRLRHKRRPHRVAMWGVHRWCKEA